MLRILVTAVAGLIAVSACAQNSYVIKGKIDARHNGQKIMLQYVDKDIPVNDSAVVTNGSFFLKGKVGDVVKAYLNLKPLKEHTGAYTADEILSEDYQDFFLENKNFTIEGKDLRTAVIKGGPAQADYLALHAAMKTLEDKRKILSDQQIRASFNDKDTATMNKIAPQLEVIYDSMFRIQNTFIKQHPDSYVSLDLLNERGSVIDPETFEPYFSALSTRMKNTTTGKRLGNRLRIAKTTDVGRTAPEFTLNNSKGTPVSLASLKGRYVLVDFWASWCAPCRAENPEVLKVYNKYKDRKFEIIAVSLDEKKEAWLKAIETDGLPWIQVSDLKGWKNTVAVLYGITSVPQNFLLGPDGVIIAKNLRGEDLEKELEKIFPVQ